MKRHSLNRSRFVLLGIILVAQLGCAGKNLLNGNGNAVPHADESNPVRKIVCIWEPVQGQGLDGLSTRGFAGQIMFFTHGSPLPSTSDGDVRVTLYHDRGTHEEQIKPLHQFDFPTDAWATHLQESTPGPSYRIFIPYVAKHPWQAGCALRVRLTAPNNGPTVHSELVHVRLDGPVEKKADEQTSAPAKPKLAGASPDISEFQLGASLNRGGAGKRRTIGAAEKASIIERAMHVSTPDQHKPTGPNKASGPVRLTSAKQLAEPVDDTSAPNADDAAQIQHIEQLLQQLKRKQRQKPKRAAVPRAEPDKLPEAKRFRLSQTTSADVSPQQRATTAVHPLDESKSSPHPLEGF